MNNKTSLKWLEREENFFGQSILALFGALFAAKVTTFSILGQPCNWRVSFGLFIFCILFRTKNHFGELRLKEFYSDFTKSQTDYGKSVEQITDRLYLYLSHFLCLAIVHFYIFLATFFVYLILDQYFNKVYIKHQIDKKLRWGEDKFDQVRLFKSWLYMSYFEMILILSAFYLIYTLNLHFNLIAYLFILLLCIIEILLDWVFLNKDFYFVYFEDEI